MGIQKNLIIATALIACLSHAFSPDDSLAAPNRWRNQQVRNPDPSPTPDSSSDFLLQYLTHDLKQTEPEQFYLSLALQKRLEKMVSGAADPEAAGREFALKYFSEKSVPPIVEIFRALTRTQYANAMVLGPAGVGKTFLLDQLTAFYSLGIYPDSLKKALGFEPEQAGQGSPFKLLQDAFIGNTHIVLIDSALLSADNSKPGQPWNSEDARMRSVLAGLFQAAKQEFLENHHRTIFVVDEAAILKPLVQEALKKPLDATGFHNPSDAFWSVKDAGYHVLPITTPDEKRKMVKGDPAIERRYKTVLLKEPDEEEAFRIVSQKAESEWTGLYGLKIQPEAIEYLIHQRKLLNNPPLAMPACVLDATNDLFTWKMANPGSNPQEIDLKDAQTFFIQRAGLSPIWLEGPNGEPPLTGLAEEVKKYCVGQDDVIEKIADRIQAWARLGGKLPVFLLGGPSGSGKDTLVEAFNRALFGHDGRHLVFSIGGAKGFSINALFEGPPVGNHSDEEIPVIIKRQENGPPNGLIALNEGKDAPSEELEKLKVPLEYGEIRPNGKDSRVRLLHFPIFVLGQWGEERYDGVTDAREIARIRGSLTQQQIDEDFLKGNGGDRGAFSKALLDRAQRTGGVFELAPVPHELYPAIEQISIEQTAWDVLKKKKLAVTVDPSLVDYVARVAKDSGLGPRKLDSVLGDFTVTAISKAFEKGLPQRNVAVNASYRKNESGTDLIVIKSGERSWEFEAAKLRRIKLSCEEELLKKK